MTNRSTMPRVIQFRLHDLIVLLFISAIILALITQWLLPAREAARRLACQMNLKAIGQRLNSYEQAFMAYPQAAPSCTTDAWHSTGIETGQTCVGPNWVVQILSGMDEPALARAMHKEIERSGNSAVDFNGKGIGNMAPSFMFCPTSSVPLALHESSRTQLDTMAKSNYAACLGNSTYLHSVERNEFIDAKLEEQISPLAFAKIQQSRGVITVRMMSEWQEKVRLSGGKATSLWLYAHGKGTKRSEIKDGLSHTVLVSEVLPVDTNQRVSDDIRGVWLSASMGASTYSHATTPNSTTPDKINGCDAAAAGHLKCVEIPPGTAQEGDTIAAARSLHSAGVNVVFADGSSAFYTNHVDPKIWRSLASRAAGDNEE